MTDTMKKLAVLLIGTLFVICVAIVLTVSLPVSTAFAEETYPEPDPPINVEEHNHTDGTWTELTSDGGTLESGNYYLTSDVTLSTDITIKNGATVTLCLNGYKFTGTGTGSVITVDIRADLILEDCRSESDADECQHTYYVADSGLWVFYEGMLPEGAPDGAVTGIVTGGVIAGGNVATDGSTFTSGGGVYVKSTGTFTMKGGTIAGNTAQMGGGMCAWVSLR